MSAREGRDAQHPREQQSNTDGQSGVLPLPKTPEPSAVATEGTLQFKAAPVDAPTPEYLHLQLVSPTGMTLAQNSYRYAVLM